MKYSLVIIVAALLLLGVWYVVSNDQASKNDVGQLSIVTSFYPLEFAISRIVGNLAEVTNVGTNRDPHDFNPSAQDILLMQQADLVVLHGVGLEPWGEKIQGQLQSRGVPVAIATAELPLLRLEKGHDEHHDEHEETANEPLLEDTAHHVDAEPIAQESESDHDDHGEFDPHSWLDPVLMSETVEHLALTMVKLDPENAAAYKDNAASLQAELAELHSQYESTLTSCSAREVITSHDAFGYVSERYNFAIHTIGGISTQDVPSAKTLAELKEEAKEGINAILLEENQISAYGETLARETGLKTLSVNPIEHIVPKGENYLTIMRTNLSAFATALQCK